MITASVMKGLNVKKTGWKKIRLQLALNKTFWPTPPPLCIPLCGNIPLHGNAVCILFISSERVGIFQLNFAAQIQVSVETT